LHIVEKLREQQLHNAKERKEISSKLKVMTHERCLESQGTPPLENPLVE